MKKYEIVIQDDKGNTLQTIPAKHKTLTNKEAHKIIEAFDLAIKALEERPHGKWIPVSKRLPKKNGLYIVTEKQFSMDRSLSDKFDIIVEPVEYSNGKWQRANFYQVIAWMPLPEPYKEAENE